MAVEGDVVRCWQRLRILTEVEPKPQAAFEEERVCERFQNHEGLEGVIIQLHYLTAEHHLLMVFLEEGCPPLVRLV